MQFESAAIAAGRAPALAELTSSSALLQTFLDAMPMAKEKMIAA
jgi:hypothetical protein